MSSNNELEEQANKIRLCTSCPLSCSRTLAVPGEGCSHADVMFIGEAPGSEEDSQGRPFVGAAGKKLDALLLSIDLKRDDIFITNVVKCRPPMNRVPTLDEIKLCFPYLQKQISIVNPKIVCSLGNTALETLTGFRFISRVHGKLLKKSNLLIFPMYHPAATLHNPLLKSTAEIDFLKLKESIKETISKRSFSKHENERIDRYI